MTKTLVAAKLQRRKKSPSTPTQRQPTISTDIESDPILLFKWYSICMAWWLAVMRHTDHPSQKLLRHFWNKIPFRQSIVIFQQAVLLQKEKIRKGSNTTSVIHIKRAFLDRFEKWQDRDELGALETLASQAVNYRLARSACSNDPLCPTLITDVAVRRLFRNALAHCKGDMVHPTPSRVHFQTAHVPFKHALPTTKHRYKHIDWMPFPVRCLVIHSDASIYAGHRYAGAWFRPNAQFFTDIQRLPRTFGKLGSEVIFLGYVNALKPYGSVESVVPESLESFRKEKGTRDTFQSPLFTVEQIRQAARPFLYQFGITHVDVGSLDAAVHVISEASLAQGGGARDDEEKRRAAQSYYRGVLLHILCDGSRRKQTRPRPLNASSRPVYSSIRTIQTKPSHANIDLLVSDIFRMPRGMHDDEPVVTLQAMMAKLRLQSIDPTHRRCWSCAQPCHDSSLQTADAHQRVMHFCSELCYTTQTSPQ